MKTLRLTKLRKQVIAEVDNYRNGRLEQLQEAKTIDSIKSNWQLSDYLTATTKRDGYFHSLKDMKTGLKNHKIFGYGSGYGILPQLEGGVGVSCYPDIFKTVGLKFETIASGSNFDVFKITKA